MTRERPAFTVLEAAVALLIIGLSAIGVLTAVGGHTRAAVQVRRQLEASALAQDVVARVRLIDPRELVPLADSLARGRFTPPFEAYAWTARVSRVAAEESLFEIAVQVTTEGGDFDLRARRFAPPSRLELR